MVQNSFLRLPTAGNAISTGARHEVLDLQTRRARLRPCGRSLLSERSQALSGELGFLLTALPGRVRRTVRQLAEPHGRTGDEPL